MTLFETVKNSITVKQAAEHYGCKVNRGDMICCPFHDDRHPSMKLNRDYFYCFGCGATGDVIDFVARLFGLSSYEAAKKLAYDFGIDPDNPPVAMALNKPHMNVYPSIPKAPNSADRIPSRNDGTAMNNLSCGGPHGRMWQTAIWSAPDMRNASTTAAMPSVACWSGLRSMRVWLPEPWRKRVLSLTDVN